MLATQLPWDFHVSQHWIHWLPSFFFLTCSFAGLHPKVIFSEIHCWKRDAIWISCSFVSSFYFSLWKVLECIQVLYLFILLRFMDLKLRFILFLSYFFFFLQLLFVGYWISWINPTSFSLPFSIEGSKRSHCFLYIILINMTHSLSPNQQFDPLISILSLLFWRMSPKSLPNYFVDRPLMNLPDFRLFFCLPYLLLTPSLRPVFVTLFSFIFNQYLW